MVNGSDFQWLVVVAFVAAFSGWLWWFIVVAFSSVWWLM